MIDDIITTVIILFDSELSTENELHLCGTIFHR